jgi:hypothetical protein
MENEKNFKKYISELANKIVEADVAKSSVRAYKARQDKSRAVNPSGKFSGINYTDVSIPDNLKREALKVISNLQADLEDEVKTASISKVKTRYEQSVVFKIKFENSPTFIGIVSADPEDLPEPKGSTPLNPPDPPAYTEPKEKEKYPFSPGAGDIEKPSAKTFPTLPSKRTMSFNIPGKGDTDYKPFTMDTAKKMVASKKDVAIYYQGDSQNPKGWRKVTPVELAGQSFIVKEKPKKGKKKAELKKYQVKDISNYVLENTNSDSYYSLLMEVLREKPTVKAGFTTQADVDQKGNIINKGSITTLDNNSDVGSSTKKLIYDFLNDLGMEVMTSKDYQKTLNTIKDKLKNKKMREEDFKGRISEIAARIAEESPNKSSQPDAEKVKEIISGITRAKEALGRINNATELGDVMMGLMPMMSLDPTQFINGLNRAVKLAAEFKQKNNPSEPVSTDSKNAAYDGMPKNKLNKPLAEAYDKIRKK